MIAGTDTIRKGLDRGIVAEWIPSVRRRGGSLYDFSGRRHHALLVNSPSWSSDSPAGGEGSLVLNGTNQYADVGKPAALQSIDSYTVSVWFKVDSARGGSSFDYLISQYGGDEINNGDILFYIGPSGEVVHRANKSGNVSLTSSPVTEDEWHFGLASVAGGIRADLYIDGALEASDLSVAETPFWNAPENILIGRINTVNNFQGWLGRIRIYNRALSAVEVRALYYDQQRIVRERRTPVYSSSSDELLDTPEVIIRPPLRLRRRVFDPPHRGRRRIFEEQGP